MNARTLFAVLALAVASPSWAVLTQATSQPSRTTINVTQGGQPFIINWVVTTTPIHPDGAVSAAGTFVNAATGAVIAPPVATPIGVPTGTGPLNFPETVTISTAQLQAWRAQGIRVVGYRRTFTAVASPPVTGQWLIQLRGSGLEGSREAIGGELTVQRLDLEFPGGKRIAVVERGEALDAQVTVAYSGSGLLRGRWEVSGPGADGSEFFRGLGLVRENLAGGRATTIKAPALPTHATGRYLLRFCVEGEGVDQCASAAVESAYQVVAGSGGAALRGVTPANQSVSAATTFRWPAADGTVTYQLQIFRPQLDGQAEPKFVSGILLPGDESETVLSPLVLSRLSAGEAYLWRVTAHDADGNLLASSELTRFVFRP